MRSVYLCFDDILKIHFKVQTNTVKLYKQGQSLWDINKRQKVNKVYVIVWISRVRDATKSAWMTLQLDFCCIFWLTAELSLSLTNQTITPTKHHSHPASWWVTGPVVPTTLHPVPLMWNTRPEHSIIWVAFNRLRKEGTATSLQPGYHGVSALRHTALPHSPGSPWFWSAAQNEAVTTPPPPPSDHWGNSDSQKRAANIQFCCSAEQPHRTPRFPSPLLQYVLQHLLRNTKDLWGCPRCPSSSALLKEESTEMLIENYFGHVSPALPRS